MNKAKPVHADRQKWDSTAPPSFDAKVGQKPVFPQGRVPYDDIVSRIRQANQAIAGTQELDFVAVAHEGVVDLLEVDRCASRVTVREGIEVEDTKHRLVADEQGLIGEGADGVSHLLVSEATVVYKEAPSLGDAAAA